MNKQQDLEMIRALSDAKGAPGFEDEVLTVVRKYAEGLGEMSEDCMRNLYIRPDANTGNRPVVQLDAHTDEVAFMVHAIKPNGTISFITLGGWVASNIPAHKVWVRNDEGKYVPGVVASKPPHFMTEAERKQNVTVDNLVIDIGSTSRDETINDFKIRVGAPIVPDVSFTYDDEHDLMVGKAFDCRLGVAAIINTLTALKGEQLNVDLVGAVASQEEVGSRGATVTAHTVKPDIAIVFEGCPADDTFTEPYAIQTAIKKGPMLRHIDARMITNPRFQRLALDLGRELGIPVQDSVRAGGSTNGAPIHTTYGGVPVIVIGLPVRYIHTHYSIASYSDFESAVKLAVAVIKKLDEKTIRSF